MTSNPLVPELFQSFPRLDAQNLEYGWLFRKEVLFFTITKYRFRACLRDKQGRGKKKARLAIKSWPNGLAGITRDQAISV